VEFFGVLVSISTVTALGGNWVVSVYRRLDTGEEEANLAALGSVYVGCFREAKDAGESDRGFPSKTHVCSAPNATFNATVTAAEKKTDKKVQIQTVLKKCMAKAKAKGHTLFGLQLPKRKLKAVNGTTGAFIRPDSDCNTGHEVGNKECTRNFYRNLSLRELWRRLHGFLTANV
jgi:hypothetical protein